MTLRVLIVDDSAYNRQIISEVLESHYDIKVVGKADDGEQGLKLAASLRPDLITLDIEMPRMDGFTFLRLLMSSMPTPVIVISSHSRRQEVFQALELGALDFVAKPERYLPPEGDRLREEILSKALAVKSLQIIPFKNRTSLASASGQGADVNSRNAPESSAIDQRVSRLVIIGASTGGPPALQSLFKSVNHGINTAFCVAQHMPEKFTKAFADRLNRVSGLSIDEAEDGVILRGGHVYVAPGGCHLTVVQHSDGSLRTALESVAPEDRYIPSIDKLFASVAKLPAQVKKMAVVLTGMGSDGSIGIRALSKAGGICVAESQESSIVFGMPKEAARTGCVQHVEALDDIIERVYGFANGREV